MDDNIDDFLNSVKEKIFKKDETITKDLIGNGTIGNVYKIKNPNTNKFFALKIIPKTFSKDLILPLINFSKNFKKPYFAKVYNLFETEENYYIVMEYYEYNLNFFVKDGITLKNIFKIIEKLNPILIELNSKNLYFRNLKPENIFIINSNGSLDENFDIILSDCCNIYIKIYYLYPKYFAFKNFFAPEIKINGAFDVTSDIWSLGNIIFYMLFSIYNENNKYILDYKYLDSIKHKNFEEFLLNLMAKELKFRYNWNKYFQEFEKIRNEISEKDYDEIIDLSIICDNEFQINFFMPNQDFDNIIIKLTEFSKSQYVNSHILYPDNFDVRGNKMPFEYSKEQRRGNMKYIPPLGWIGIGLNITGYPDWEIRCGHCNKEGEWCVAYHGTDIENAKNIIIEGLKPGKRQAYKDRIDKEGDKIGEGVYFSPLIEVAEYYSNPKKGIKCVFMCRVNPKHVKQPGKKAIYVINEPDIDVIPYRLLIRGGYDNFIN